MGKGGGKREATTLYLKHYRCGHIVNRLKSGDQSVEEAFPRLFKVAAGDRNAIYCHAPEVGEW
eukprot:5083117-Heterocapsa_arctica.AAC.1